MKIDVVVHVHLASVDEVMHINQQLVSLTLGMEKIMALLDKIEADVTANKDVIDSAVILLKGLKQKLDDAGTDPVKLAALSDALEVQTKNLADAIVENTPAA